jgi:hypothetical protein
VYGPPSKTVHAAFVPVPSPAVAAEVLDDEIVLLDEATGKLHVLDARGAQVWTACNGERTVRAISVLLAAAHQADPPVVYDDVVAFVQRLVDARVVVSKPVSGARRNLRRRRKDDR